MCVPAPPGVFLPVLSMPWVILGANKLLRREMRARHTSVVTLYGTPTAGYYVFTHVSLSILMWIFNVSVKSIMKVHVSLSILSRSGRAVGHDEERRVFKRLG